jgi:hypothetical protein
MATMKKATSLIPGATVIFSKKPPGSWLSEGVPYFIESNYGKTVHFRNPVFGGGTFDSVENIEYAEFTVQGAI